VGEIVSGQAGWQLEAIAFLLGLMKIEVETRAEAECD
jgi:hypothetical protein